MIFHLSVLVLGRGLITEFPELKKEHSFQFRYQEDTIRESNSKYAFVTSYSGETINDQEIMKVEVLGYNLMSLAPDIDRILIIPTNLDLGFAHEDRLVRVWNRIYGMNHMTFPCEKSMKNHNDRHYWLKLTAWKLHVYEKLLWVGHNNFFVKDPSAVFEYQAPAAPPDYQIWNVSEYGVVHNCDFFLFEPSHEHYLHLRQMACDWIDSPEVSNRRKRYGDAVNIGAYDNGLLEEFYEGNITTIPHWWNFEFPGIRQETNRHNDETDHRIVSYRFSNNFQPWHFGSALVPRAYTILITKAHKFMRATIDLSNFDLKAPSENSAYENVMNNSLKVKPIDKHEILVTFQEFAKVSVGELLLKIAMIVGVSVSIVLYSIKNVHK